MRGKITTLLIVAVLCLSLTGIAAAPDPGEPDGCWEPCGTKVYEGDIDVVYRLSDNFPGNGPRFAYFDYANAGSLNQFDGYDTAYLDMNGNGFIDTNMDIRLTAWHNVPEDHPDYETLFKYEPNTKVGNDDDQDLPLVDGNQQVIYYLDLDGNAQYDLNDPVYINVDGTGAQNEFVEIHDVRLTANDFGPGYEAYTTVGTYDADKGEQLTYLGTFANLLDYIDDDADGSWSCPDKLYLQQLKPTQNNDGITDIDPEADFYATIGDLRIYVPPEAIISENWPSCGTKVMEGDIDATYTLSVPATVVRIGYHDLNTDGAFNGMDSAYVDIVNVAGASDRVDNGDVRITAHHNVPPEDTVNYKFPPNTKVLNDEDQDLPLAYPNQNGLIKYFESNDPTNAPGYDIGDPVYVDMDENGGISLYDIRLTPRYDLGYPAYSTVSGGDVDLFDSKPLLPLRDGATTPADLIGYIDDDCSGSWTCTDKLYLEQPWLGAETIERVVTIGDIRVYIPPEAIENEEWPSCGTKVEQCDIDAVYRTKTTGVTNAELKFYDFNTDGNFNDGDTIYLDINNANNRIEAGDIRLTPWHNVPETDDDFKYPANTKVANDDDLNKIFSQVAVDQIVKFYEMSTPGNPVYDIDDPIYIDINNDDVVSINDLRLTSTSIYGPYTIVKDGDLDQGRGLTDNFGGNVGDIDDLISYIDSDCSNSWTCVDKLYLNLPNRYRGAVTIGDLRLYIPPEEIANGNDEPPVYNQYDANEDCEIDIDELSAAIDDFYAGTLDIDDLSEVIDYFYLGGAGYC